MASHSSLFANLYRLGFLPPSKLSSRSSSTRYHFSSHISSNLVLKVVRSNIRVNASHRLVRIAAMDEDSVASFSLDGYGESDDYVAYAFSSSDGEESDGDMMLNPITDVDLPTTRKRFRQRDDALAVTTHELAVLGRMRKKSSKMVVPLPLPVGLVRLGKLYLILTSFSFVSTANGVNLTDGLDGLAGGTAALAFIGMSIAVLPICSDLAVFGASMAGACVGFLFHNRYKASVFMGDTGSLALGGALAAMASCTGMFIPLLVSSGIFVLEALSVLIQVSYFKATKYLHGTGRHLFRMVPFHLHLELCGLREPIIVASAYVLSSMLMLYGGYIGLVSA